MQKHLMRLVWGVCWIAAATSAWAQQAPTITAPLGEQFKVPNLLVKQESRVFFYRLPSESGQGAASVYVNGGYQASLQRGAYSVLCMVPAKAEVSARMVHNGQHVRDSYDVVNTLMLQGGQDLFVRVSEQANGKVVLQTVNPKMALTEMLPTRKQQHTLSRVPGAVACQEQAKPTFVTARTITLGADALFAFGKSNIEAIPPKGRRILDHLIDRIKTEFGTGDDVKLHVVGHADPFGPDEGNLRLSRERADTIKTYFVQGGLQGKNISTEGRGFRELIVKSCGKQYNAKNVKCNEPNRRVEVKVNIAERKQDSN
jgi:OmpA-OmpF porin, OOP family